MNTLDVFETIRISGLALKHHLIETKSLTDFSMFLSSVIFHSLGHHSFPLPIFPFVQNTLLWSIIGKNGQNDHLRPEQRDHPLAGAN
jgi:hypothetical protein